MNTKGTRQRALTEARSMLQRFGFNGFSFAHVAKRLNIKAPSLYDHFESKEELGNRLIDGYREQLEEWYVKIAPLGAEQKVRLLFRAFAKFSQDRNKLCPVTVLAADFQTLPKSMQKNLKSLLNIQQEWLESVIAEGVHAGIFRVKNIRTAASSIYAMGLGAQSLARINSESKEIDVVCEQAIEFLMDQNVLKRKEAK